MSEEPYIGTGRAAGRPTDGGDVRRGWVCEEPSGETGTGRMARDGIEARRGWVNF